MEVLLVFYVLFIILTIYFAVTKKTSWLSLLGVIIFPIYFIWVLVDAFRTSQKKEESKKNKTENKE